MRDIFRIFLAVSLLSLPAGAQQTAFRDSLLDHLTGAWVLQGVIGGSETTHDVSVDWVLGHQYVRLQEVSREKDAAGRPAYEAIVFIGWDQPSNRYVCLWLDSTGGGGLKGEALGYAARNGGDEIPFVFNVAGSGPFHTTFSYDPENDSWRWFMDGEEGGKLLPFARVRLSRK